MPFSEEELLPLSALQHLLFCERQCALIHVEREWEENRLTAEGRVLHENAHEPGHETRNATRSVRALQIRSLELGIAGVADVVEFHAPAGQRAADLSNVMFWTVRGALQGWRVVPVEYKRGRRKTTKVDEVQVCAQALCLEEMLEIEITEAALFYGQEQGRVTVSLDRDLRAMTARLCARLREIISGNITPPAIRKPACKQCSLIEVCMPEVTAGFADVSRFFLSAIEANLGESGPKED